MRYDDFAPEDKNLIDAFLARYNETYWGDAFDPAGITPDELQDDEIFFRTREEMLDVVGDLDARYEKGSYRDMADGLLSYFDGAEYDVGDLVPYELDWGTIARVGNGRYLVMSNSWSDSGVFFSR